MERRHEQITIADYLQDHHNIMVENWGQWRDAQCDNDANKVLVDLVYVEYMRTLDVLMQAMVPF